MPLTYLLISVLPLLSFLSLVKKKKKKSEWKSGFKGITPRHPSTEEFQGADCICPLQSPAQTPAVAVHHRGKTYLCLMTTVPGQAIGLGSLFHLSSFSFQESPQTPSGTDVPPPSPRSPDSLRQGTWLELTSWDPLDSTSISLEFHINFIP